MAAPRDLFSKRWRITSIEGWDKDDLDLLGPAYIEFDRTGTGGFQLLAISGYIDYRITSEADGPLVEWSWSGDDDGTDTFGRGWARLEVDDLVGRILIHHGDELPFRATPTKPRRIRRTAGNESAG